jgi:hypothetical protein
MLDSIKENDLHSVFETWRKHLDRCISSQGEYFEGIVVSKANFFLLSPGTFRYHLVMKWIWNYTRISPMNVFYDGN